ncbi:MAG: hypothetical protein DRG78_00075 [Epsilonproteobacteria bacterium]|nr:MAG: hypothetical protein DRG78_00075 [Campylobacterota bacterium]
MSVVLGLNPCLYLSKNKSTNKEDRYIRIANLQDKFSLAKENNIKYLYHGHFDYSIPNIENLLNTIKEDNSYIALNFINPFEYCENIYTLHGNLNNSYDLCDLSVSSTIISLFIELVATYGHNVVISDIDIIHNINETNFFFTNTISYSTNLMTYFPSICNSQDFMNHFSLYHWFFGRNKKRIILSDTFKKQIDSLENDDIYNVLTSLFRGIYYPDYKVGSDKTSVRTDLTIKAHSDIKTKKMSIDNDNCTLIRIHCVALEKKKGGKKRILYVEYNNYIIVFYYDKKHNDKINHEEKIRINKKDLTLKAKRTT